MLPIEFLKRMEYQLKEEYPRFLESYAVPAYHALRVNTLKGSISRLRERAPFALSPVPWEDSAFYYASEDQPGKHPYHEAGAYYIQEPSAMVPAALLEAAPGERVLDLCAAPGGKSTQIASGMRGKGVLVCNEIHPARAKVLSENIERMGIRNAIVTNESPETLAESFPGYFDRILVDAPCSGEGMFRKNEEACGEWSTGNVQLCAVRQDGILEQAAAMLRPGGRLVYSTCTFAPEENEGSISRFLHKHPEFYVCEAKGYEGFAPGVPGYVEEPAEGIGKTIRLWPHRLEGEGHFTAVLARKGSVSEAYEGYSRYGMQKGIRKGDCREYAAFEADSLRIPLEGTFFTFGEQLYLGPEGMPSLHKLRVLRPGLHVGTLKKERFEPSHALALVLGQEEVRHVFDISASDRAAAAYLNGQTLHAEGEKGWYLITVDGYSIGWGKLAAGIMKNHYPKGLRKNI